MAAKNPTPDETKDVERRIAEIRELRRKKNFKDAEIAGKSGLKLYPRNAALLLEHALTGIAGKSWTPSIERLDRLMRIQRLPQELDETIGRLATIFIGLGQAGEARLRVSEALEKRPDSLALRHLSAELDLLKPGGSSQPEPWRSLAVSPELRQLEAGKRVRLIAACVAGLRLAGCRDEARELLVKHLPPGDPTWLAGFADGYVRAVVFDNGRTRVEYFTKLFDPATVTPVEGERLVLTFDVMEQTWDKEPYAYRALVQRNFDIVGVRKRTKDDFFQDFRREDFLAVVAPIAKYYPDVIANGQSLGGYCALYYATWLEGCRILATAPRIPLNPKYAGKRYASHRLFIHEYDMPKNEAVSPVIVYDPRNKEDRRYVEKSLLVSFPKSKLLHYPYCGHSITRYLRDLGTLKSAVLDFCEGEPFPQFDKKRRGESAEYLRNVAKLNLAAGRLKWARALAVKALELNSDAERSTELLAKIDAQSPG